MDKENSNKLWIARGNLPVPHPNGEMGIIPFELKLFSAAQYCRALFTLHSPPRGMESFSQGVFLSGALRNGSSLELHDSGLASLSARIRNAKMTTAVFNLACHSGRYEGILSELPLTLVASRPDLNL